MFSITMAVAPPPPLQMAATPNLALCCFSTLSKVTMMRQPLAPMGCPSATAPPKTLTLIISVWLGGHQGFIARRT